MPSSVFFGEQFSPFSSLWFPKISVVYSCSFKEYQYISEKSRTHSRRYRGWNPWFYGNVSIMVIKAWMSNYNCLTMMILRKCRANYEELTSLINKLYQRPWKVNRVYRRSGRKSYIKERCSRAHRTFWLCRVRKINRIYGTFREEDQLWLWRTEWADQEILRDSKRQ